MPIYEWSRAADRKGDRKTPYEEMAEKEARQKQAERDAETVASLREQTKNKQVDETTLSARKREYDKKQLERNVIDLTHSIEHAEELIRGWNADVSSLKEDAELAEQGGDQKEAKYLRSEADKYAKFAETEGKYVLKLKSQIAEAEANERKTLEAKDTPPDLVGNFNYLVDHGDDQEIFAYIDDDERVQRLTEAYAAEENEDIHKKFIDAERRKLEGLRWRAKEPGETGRIAGVVWRKFEDLGRKMNRAAVDAENKRNRTN